MAYTPAVWKDGDTITAEKMNHLEQGVVSAQMAPEGGLGVASVTSFNGRTGAVVPGNNDYTAAMVGARPDTWTPTAYDVGAATMTQVNAAILEAITGAIQEAY